LLGRLESAGIVCQTGSDSDAAYLLARPAGMVTILDVVGVESPPRPASPEARGYDSGISETVTRAWARARSALGNFTLADVIASQEPSASEDSRES
jgi:DNA-binding IscR family transcriptional regulator